MDTTSGIINHNNATHGSKKGRGGKRLLLEIKFILAIFLGGVFTASILLTGFFYSNRFNIDIEKLSSTFLGIRIPADYFFYAGIGILLLSIFILGTWRLVLPRRAALERSNGCPNCHEHELLRVQRFRMERIVCKLLFLKLIRCACRNCSWQGLLIGSKHDAPADWLAQPIHKSEEELLLNFRPSEITENPRVPFKQTPMYVKNGASLSDLEQAQIEVVNPGKEFHESNPDEFFDRTEPTSTLEIETRAVVVSPFGLKLREKPHTKGKVLKLLKPNEIVDLIKQQDMEIPVTWRRVKAGQEVGWVSAAFLKRLNGGNLNGFH